MIKKPMFNAEVDKINQWNIDEGFRLQFYGFQYDYAAWVVSNRLLGLHLESADFLWFDWIRLGEDDEHSIQVLHRLQTLLDNSKEEAGIIFVDSDENCYPPKVYYQGYSKDEAAMLYIKRIIKTKKLLEIKPPKEPEDNKLQQEEWHSWEHIPPHLWDELAVELWCGGHSNTYISQRVHQAPRTVTNRISWLRKNYPKAKIPTNEQRYKLMIKNDKT